MSLNKQQFRNFLVEEPMISDVVQFLKDNFIDDLDNEWLIELLERSNNNTFVVESPDEEFDVLEGPLTHNIFRSLHQYTIYSLS